MIQLHPDYLIFQTSKGDYFPCSAETVTIELIGEIAGTLDPNVVKEAAAAVVHYFRHELGKESVSIGEFSEALEKVLNGLGFNVVTSCADEEKQQLHFNLEELSPELTDRFELGFFTRLRQEFRSQAQKPCEVLTFTGLRSCVKKLAGRKRWCSRCDYLSDQIVEYLRECLIVEPGASSKGLVVR